MSFFPLLPTDILTSLPQYFDDLSFFRGVLLTSRCIHVCFRSESMQRTRAIVGIISSQCELCDRCDLCIFNFIPVCIHSRFDPDKFSQISMFHSLSAILSRRLKYTIAWVWSLCWTTRNTYNNGSELVISSERLHQNVVLIGHAWNILCDDDPTLGMSLQQFIELKLSDSFDPDDIHSPSHRPNYYTLRQCLNLYRFQHYLTNTIRLANHIIRGARLFNYNTNKVKLLKTTFVDFDKSFSMFFDTYNRQPVSAFSNLTSFDYTATARWIVMHPNSPFCAFISSQTRSRAHIHFQMKSCPDIDLDTNTDTESRTTTKFSRGRALFSRFSKIDRIKKRTTSKRFAKTVTRVQSLSNELFPALFNYKHSSRMGQSQRDPAEHIERRQLKRMCLNG